MPSKFIMKREAQTFTNRKRSTNRVGMLDSLTSCLRYICIETGCTSTFRQPYDLIRHRKTIHGPKQRCIYDQCQYATARSDKMKEHIRRKHTESGKSLSFGHAKKPSESCYRTERKRFKLL
jgi:hypothetical protein